MEAIKNLFKLKNVAISKPQTEKNENTEEAREQIRITYYQTGYGAAIKPSEIALFKALGANIAAVRLLDSKSLKKAEYDADT